MTICTIPGSGPTALGLGLAAAAAEHPLEIPNGATIIKPIDHICEEHGEVMIVAEFGKIDILSCGCEFDTRS